MGDTTLIRVKVVPGSSKTCVAGWLGATLKLRVTATAEHGKANRAVIALLADVLRIAKNEVSITAGLASPQKIVSIQGLTESQIRERVDCTAR